MIPRTYGSCEYLTILDLNVNSTIQIFDRVYFITGCDQFTRNFLNRAGVSVADKQETPSYVKLLAMCEIIFKLLCLKRSGARIEKKSCDDKREGSVP